MFFIVSKIGFFFVQPSNFLLASAVVGWLVTWTRWARAGRWLAGLALALLLFIGLSPAANWLMAPLEQRFPLPELTALPENIAGIIVLGGAMDTSASEGRRDVALNEAAERMMIVPYLSRLFPQAVIVHSGGQGDLVPGDVSEADGARRLFRDFGIDDARVLLEGASRNTHENAVFTKRLIEGCSDGNWLLVTSAYHMPRAMGVFRQAGHERLIAYPVDYRVIAEGGESYLFSGVSSGLLRFDTAFREWLGLTVYWLTGRSSDLFPAP
ncbi:YdcF family protein [Roseibium sp.]|uniref:YdcF family protein n=1 Tax=Roseibium sp. TaxID=1936156 RepID=UPI003A976E03